MVAGQYSRQMYILKGYLFRSWVVSGLWASKCAFKWHSILCEYSFRLDRFIGITVLFLASCVNFMLNFDASELP
jgi:hypothetical protein